MQEYTLYQRSVPSMSNHFVIGSIATVRIRVISKFTWCHLGQQRSFVRRALEPIIFRLARIRCYLVDLLTLYFGRQVRFHWDANDDRCTCQLERSFISLVNFHLSDKPHQRNYLGDLGRWKIRVAFRSS